MGNDEQRTSQVASTVLDADAADAGFDGGLHRAFATELRCRTLYLLCTRHESTSREELATLLAGWAATDDGRMRSAEDRDRVRTALHHRDLPLLADLGFIAFDPASGSVSVRSIPDAVVEAVVESVSGAPEGP